MVRDGSFLAVVAEREFQAIKAMRALAAAAHGTRQPTLPDQADLPAAMHALAAQTKTIHDQHEAARDRRQRRVEATYHQPYNMHGSIGPSCAVALADGDGMTVWTHTPGRLSRSRRDRRDARTCRRSRCASCIMSRAAGCYGHNGADDAAADAALIARAVPGRPVRVQWMREQEHAWEPYGPAMVTKVARRARRATAASPTGTTASGATRIRRGPARPAR